MSGTSTPRTSALSTPRSEAIRHPMTLPLPNASATTEAIRAWILAWHTAHGVSISASILERVTWTGRWIHEQPPAQLESEIFSWGVPQGRGRILVLDLVRERRGMVVMREVSDYFGGVGEGQGKVERLIGNRKSGRRRHLIRSCFRLLRG